MVSSSSEGGRSANSLRWVVQHPGGPLGADLDRSPVHHGMADRGCVPCHEEGCALLLESCPLFERLEGAFVSDSSRQAIENLSTEYRVFPPSEEFSAQANAKVGDPRTG